MEKKWRIPLRFREQLLKRFDPGEAFKEDVHWIIDIPCVLCEESNNVCAQCCLGPAPCGCEELLAALGLLSIHKTGVRISVEYIYWRTERDKGARECLAQARLLADELIEWEEE